MLTSPIRPAADPAPHVGEAAWLRDQLARFAAIHDLGDVTIGTRRKGGPIVFGCDEAALRDLYASLGGASMQGLAPLSVKVPVGGRDVRFEAA